MSLIRATVLHLYALLVIAMCVIGVIEIINHAHVGLRWNQGSGVIHTVSQAIHEQSSIIKGKTIIEINDIPYEQIRFTPHLIYLDKEGTPLPTVSIGLQNPNGLASIIHVSPQQPTLGWLLVSLLPIIAAAMTSGIGLFVLFKGIEQPSRTFFYFCQLLAIMLLGFGTSLRIMRWSVLTSNLYSLVIFWIGPVILHFHYYLPQKIQGRKWKYLRLSAYISATLGTVFYFLSGIFVTYQDSINDLSNPLLSSLINLFSEVISYQYIFWLCVPIVLLVHLYRNKNTLLQQKQTAQFLLGAAIGILPSICFSFIPELITGQPLIAKHITYSFLALIPLTYFFVMHSYDLVKWERFITRNATIFLLCNVLGALYLTVKWQLREVDSFEIDLLLVGVVLVLFYPLREWLQKWIERFFYGGGYTSPEVMRHVFETMAHTAEYTPQKLASMITEIVEGVIQATSTAILLLDSQSNLRYVQPTGLDDDTIALDYNGALVSYFRQMAQVKPKDNSALLSALSHKMSEQEKQLLSPDQYKLLIPLHHEQEILGLIILGHKQGGSIFDNRDLIALGTVSHLASLILQIIETNQQVMYLNEELLKQDADVRREIASDLHNSVLSRLALLVSDLDILKIASKEQLPTEINQIKESLEGIDDIARQLIDKNYPPELTLGFRIALSALARQYAAQTPNLRIRMRFDGTDNHLDEETTLNLFRIMQVALGNVVKHSQATNAMIHIIISSDQMVLKIQDNGIGFDVDSAQRNKHFGLRIMRMMARLVGGDCTIQSTIGEGTRICIITPLGTGKGV